MNIMELKVDCCEELIEWLTLPDLKALRQACKHLKTVVDYHILSAYPKGLMLKVFQNDGLKDLRGFDKNSLCKMHNDVII